MTPVPCIAEPGEFGDCWRACISSILDLSPTEVPNFFGDVGAEKSEPGVNYNFLAYKAAREWLQPQGLGIFRFWVSGTWSLDKLLDQFSNFSPEVPFILHGEAANPVPGRDEAHAVVCMAGKLEWDPSGVGIAGPCRCGCGEPTCLEAGYWWLDVISPAANWGEGTLL